MQRPATLLFALLMSSCGRPQDTYDLGGTITMDPPDAPSPEVAVEAPPAVAVEPITPDGTCEALAKVGPGLADSFVSLRGAKTAPADIIGLVHLGEGPRFDSTVMLPGMARCQVIGPPPGGVAAQLHCGEPGFGRESDAAAFQERVRQIGACLDPSVFRLDEGATEVAFYAADPREPRVEVRNGASLTVTIWTAIPPLIDPSTFCPALDALAQKLGPTFEGTSQPAMPLPGMASCSYDNRQVSCFAYAGEEIQVATSSYRHAVMTVGGCLSTDQWEMKQAEGTTTFSHRTEASRIIQVHQRWNMGTPSMRQTMGVTEHDVSITLGPS